jgi:VWFA-related protein
VLRTQIDSEAQAGIDRTGQHKESFMRSSRSVLVATLLALPFVATAQDQAVAQSSTSSSQQGKGAAGTGQQDFLFRQTVHRVLVDIVVTDKDGKPVRGLKKSDFTVNEDGKQQRLLSFDIEDSATPAFVPPKLPPLPANTFVNLPTVPEKGPLYILLYDMVNTELVDQATSRKPLLDFVDSKPEGTRFAIFANMDGLHLIQGFTSDRALLHAAIASEGPGPHLPRQFLYGRNYGTGSTSAMVSIFNFLSEYLEGLSGRKNLLWVSGGFPMELNADPTQDRDMDDESVRQAFAAMERSQIAVYPVDAKGVESMARYEGMAQSSPAGSRSNESITKGGVATLPGTMGSFLQGTDIGSYTGGRLFTGNNDLRDLMEQAVEHGEDYYTVSYRPANEKYDGSARHIEVKLAKKGYQLAYRELYYALPPDAVETKHKTETQESRFVAAKTEDTLYANIEHGAPMLHDLLFRAHVGTVGEPALATAQQMLQLQDKPAYFRTHRKNHPPKSLPPVKLQRYLIDYGVFDPQLKTQAARTGRQATLEFAAAGYDAEGRLLNGILNDGVSTGGARPDGKNEVLFRVEQELNVPPGAAWIRVAVRDKLTNRTGTLEVQLPLKAEPATEAENAHN